MPSREKWKTFKERHYLEYPKTSWPHLASYERPIDRRICPRNVKALKKFIDHVPDEVLNGLPQLVILPDVRDDPGLWLGGSVQLMKNPLCEWRRRKRMLTMYLPPPPETTAQDIVDLEVALLFAAIVGKNYARQPHGYFWMENEGALDDLADIVTCTVRVEKIKEWGYTDPDYWLMPFCSMKPFGAMARGSSVGSGRGSTSSSSSRVPVIGRGRIRGIADRYNPKQ